jgi:hypothetical protein
MFARLFSRTPNKSRMNEIHRITQSIYRRNK